jgi:hypothetical protein
MSFVLGVFTDLALGAMLVRAVRIKDVSYQMIFFDLVRFSHGVIALDGGLRMGCGRLAQVEIDARNAHSR